MVEMEIVKNIFRVIDSKSHNISEVYKDFMLKIDEKLIVAHFV